MSIASEITRLQNIKSDIRTALGNKGIDASTHNYADFATDISQIVSGVELETLNVTENGTYTAPEGVAYSPVTVNVPDLSGLMTQITFKENTLPATVIIDGSSGATIQTKNQNLLEELYINHANDVSLQCTSCPNLVKIVASGTIRQRLNQMCAFASKLTQIEGTIDFSAMSASTWFNMFSNCFALQEIRIVPSSIKLTVGNNNFQNCTALSDNSIVSIANGLDEASTGLSISLPRAIKTRCGQIVGTVTDGVFTQDVAGSVTLTDFITNTKGWTLA